jgi:hypothetical protein
MFCVGIFLKTEDLSIGGRKGSCVAIVAEHFWYICLSSKTIASCQLRRFETFGEGWKVIAPEIFESEML